MRTLTIALSGGGTGGHFYPTVAFAKYLKREENLNLLFFGDKGGIEGQKEELLKELFDQYLLFKLPKFKGTSPLKLPLKLAQTARVVRRVSQTLGGKSFLSITFGGYTSAPLGLATRILKRPLFVHEQNAVPGMGNRFLARFAKRVFISFPYAERFFPKRKVVLTGIPVREELKLYKNLKREEVLKKLGWEERFNLLIIGGSQGARNLNLFAVELAKRLPQGFRLIHISGKRDYERVKKLYQGENLKCELNLFSYIEDIGPLLRVADFALSRSGASTSAELALFGVPTIFVPYPYAVYDHQYHNALYYLQTGGAYLFREEELDPQKVSEIIFQHQRDTKLHREKRRLMEKSFIPDAEKKMKKLLLAE